MPFPSALTSPDYTKLRAGGHKANQYLLLGSNTTVFAARVNQTSFTASFGQITFDTVTTGAYTDILEGMTVLVSSTNDKRAAYFVGRVRADGSGTVSSSTVLNVNETSATIADNDYIFVIRDYRLFHELGRYVSNTYYKDYARTFSALKPVIYGLQSTYAGVVSGSPSGFTVAFAASAVAATASATISSYLYTLPASGATVTAGSVSTASVTVRFDASATEYWVKLVVTDSGGRTQTRYISVFAIPSDLSTTVYLGASGADISGDIDNGWTATIDAFSGFTSVLDNTLAVILDVEYYGTTQTSLVSSVKFVGRIRVDTPNTKADERIALSKKAQLEIEGAAAQMVRITTPQITMRDSSAAAVWDEITKLTVWRSIVYLLEHSTFHNLYSLSFDSTADTYYAYQLLAPQGNMLSAVNDLLKSINAGLEFAPTGEARAVRNLNFLTSSERDLLTVVADFDTQDAIGFSLSHQHVDTVGVVEASGGTYFRDGGITPQMVIPLLSIAPGVAQGNAEGVSPLPSQILTANTSAALAQAELNTRAGDQYAYANGNDELTIDMRTGYNWIVPSRYQYYTWSIDATDNTLGRSYDTSNRWWCKSISIRHDNENGTKDVSAVFVLETSGTDAGATGQTVDIPPPGATDPILPYIPPIPAYPYYPPDPIVFLPTTPTIPYLPPYIAPPSTTGNIPVDGNAVVYWSASRVWYSLNFLGLNTSVAITPPNSLGTIKDVALVGKRIYVISTDGATSFVHSAPNAFTAAPAYAESSSLTGVFDAVRPTSTDGALYVYRSTSAASWSEDVDFTISDGGFTAVSDSAYSPATLAAYTGGAGWTHVYNDGVAFPSNRFAQVRIKLSLSSAVTLTAVSFNYASLNKGNNVEDGTNNPQGIIYANLTSLTDQNSLPAGTGSVSWSGTASGVTTITLFLDIGFRDDSVTCTGTGTIVSVHLEGTGVDPFASNDTATCYSSDYGATFAAERSIGTSAGAFGGIDTEKIGTPVLVGGSGQVRIATSAGGAYSDYGSATPTGTQPNAIIMPRFQFGSTSSGNVSTNTPQYLMASNVLGSSNKALLKVTSSGATFTDITPNVSSDYGLAICSRSIAMPWWSGSRIAAVLQFGSLPRLVVSTNAGSSWTDCGVLDTDAAMVTYRKGDKQMKQLFLAAGQPAYSPNHGSSIVLKSYPADHTSEPVIGIIPYG